MTALIAFSNVLMTLCYILPGFALCRMKKVTPSHMSSLSAILIYFCAPVMVFDNFLALEFTWKGLVNMGLFFVVTLIIQALFIAIIYLLFRKKFSDSRYRILSIASVMGNVGFFGLPIVKALLPDSPEAWCYSVIYLLSMNVLVFTMGVYCLTGRKDSMNIKSAIVNPTILSLICALPLHMLNVGNLLPDMVNDALSLVSRTTTPLCMIILGARLSTVPTKKLFTRPFVYAVCLCKLLLFPLFVYALTFFLPFEASFFKSLIILSAAPCASVILNMAEMYKSETENAANCVLVTTLLCFITIPLITTLI